MSDQEPMQSMPDQDRTPGAPAASAATRSRIIVATAVALLAVVGAIIPILMGVDDDSLSSSQPVQDGLEAARNNTRVSSELGNRIRAGDPIIGSLIEQGSTAEVDLTVPLVGSKGEGTLYIIGSRSNGKWSYTTLAVQLPNQANLIQLEQP